MTSTNQANNKTEAIINQKYNRIIRYLEKASQEGAEFYIQKYKLGGRLKSIHFDPSELHTNVGVRLVRYLLDAENSGDTIYVKRTNKGVKRVSFLDNDQRKSREGFLKWRRTI